MSSTVAPDGLAALRLYIPGGSRAAKTSFWHHFTAPVLAQHLLAEAHKSGIEQVMLQVVQAGYLPGSRMTRHHPELSDIRHPQCLELVDHQDRLRAFLARHRDQLKGVRAVLFLCETPLETLAGEA